MTAWRRTTAPNAADLNGSGRSQTSSISRPDGRTALVAGAGGFIGGHLVKALLDQGRTVRAVDIKPMSDWYQTDARAENRSADLSLLPDCHAAAAGMAQVFNLAADMGGMGFIETHKAACMLSVLINTHLLMAARDAGTSRFFFSSSACVYAAGHQTMTDVTALREQDAYPAEPEDGYGWEKLFSERMCRHFTEDYGIETRVARYHNVYGPHGTYDGGREKAPAAICRKVAQAKRTGRHTIDIWGDGEQTRSFMYIDDCIEGTLRLMDSDVRVPTNIGSAELVSINQMVDVVSGIAGVSLSRTHDLSAPQGVRGRNSDNTWVQQALGWAPSILLRTGLSHTYRWIDGELGGHGRTDEPAYAHEAAPA